MKAVLIVGGEGKRLRPLTDSVPKALVKINNKALIDYVIDTFKRANVNSYVLLCGYKNEELIRHFSSGYDWANIEFSMEDKPLGTGGAIKAAENIIGDEDFYLANGDIITNIDVSKLSNLKGSVVDLSVIEMKSPFGVVNANNDGEVMGFFEKPILENVWTSIGFYRATHELFDYLPDVGSIETTAFENLSRQSKITCRKFSRKDGIYWFPIDTVKAKEEAEAELISRNAGA